MLIRFDKIPLIIFLKGKILVCPRLAFSKVKNNITIELFDIEYYIFDVKRV